jgi:5-formyltetrahydrofolate cyclo-ligase
MKQQFFDKKTLAIFKEKIELRTQFKLKRQLLTEEQIKEKSQLITEKVLNLVEFKKANNIMCYVSKDTEVATHELIKKILEMNKTLAVPLIVGEGIMKPAIINDFSDLSLASFNTLQPQPSNFMEDKIDLNLMPALAVTKTGDRLGWGGGFYDSFIKKYQPKLNLALVFDCQIAKYLATTSFDQKIDGILTESQAILF